jgi:hypothetical protein
MPTNHPVHFPSRCNKSLEMRMRYDNHFLLADMAFPSLKINTQYITTYVITVILRDNT